jgi:predicted AlkP superfamily pyrophosphatase or phosphodiesterase
MNIWRFCKFCFLLLLLVITIAPASNGLNLSVTSSVAPTVIVISIDGLKPDYYLKADKLGLKIPTLRQLIKTGSYAEAVETIYPSVTYPAHTTLVTGVRPAQHGVYSNRLWQPLNSNPDWYWYAKAIKVPTLWTIAHQAGMKTAAIGWPVTTSAPEIDYQIPEIWAGDFDTSLRVGLQQATPQLAESIYTKDDLAGKKFFDDDLRTQAAVKIINLYKPQLLLVHLTAVDLMQHFHGPFSPEAHQQLETTDTQIAQIIAATKQAQIYDQTSFVVVSDHGFLPAAKVFHPGVLLAKAGFIKLNKAGQVESWQALPYNDGGSAAIMLQNPNDRLAELKIVELFEQFARKSNSPINQVVKREALAKLGANPDAACFLEPAPGFSLGTELQGSLVTEDKEHRGVHGGLPTNPGLYASLIVAGRGLQAGVHEPYTKTIHIAPTVAALLGLKMPQAEGRPIRSLLHPTTNTNHTLDTKRN